MNPPPRSRQQIQALKRLREMLLAGEFAPGERVSELAVVMRLGVSRTPVRLALTLLEHEGYLRVLPGGGFVVREFTLKDVEDAIELRGVLEGAAARLAAERRPSARQIAVMSEIVRALDEVVARTLEDSEIERYAELNGRFHNCLIDLADSEMLRRSLEHAELLPFAAPNAFVHVGAHLGERMETLRFAQRQHKAILDAIQKGEGARAEALACEHARLARRNLASAHERAELMKLIPGARLLRGAADGDEETG